MIGTFVNEEESQLYIIYSGDSHESSDHGDANNCQNVYFVQWYVTDLDNILSNDIRKLIVLKSFAYDFFKT